MCQFQAQRCQNSHFAGVFNGILQFEISWKMMKISDNANIASSQRSLELYKAAKRERKTSSVTVQKHNFITLFTDLG